MRNFQGEPKHQSSLRHQLEGVEWKYQTIVAALRAVMKAQDIQIYIEGEEHVPAEGGALLAINHTGYYDFIFGGVPAFFRGKRLVRFMAKKEIFDVPVVNALMRSMHHISVDRSDGREAFAHAIRDLEEGNLVGIFPEGTISRSFEVSELKTGAARMAEAAQVPIIPLIIWGSQRLISKGTTKHLGRNHIPILIKAYPPVPLTGDAEHDTQVLREAMVAGVSELRSRYDEMFGPFGAEDWRPAAIGGAAPTPEEAARINAQKKAEKAAKKAAKQAAKAAKQAKGDQRLAGEENSRARRAGEWVGTIIAGFRSMWAQLKGNRHD